MRNFTDTDGNRWQTALMEASYGHIMLVFDGPSADTPLHVLLPADHLRDAESMLASADEDQLQQWLADAEPWQP